jgi:hypothetical protein
MLKGAVGRFQDLDWQQDEQHYAVTGANPVVSRAVDSAICLTGYSHFYVNTALPDFFLRKNLAVVLAFVDPNGPGGTRSFDLPLLHGAEVHTYTLNLDLLNLPPSACITEFTLHVLTAANQPAGGWFRLEEAGFLSRQSRSEPR